MAYADSGLDEGKEKAVVDFLNSYLADLHIEYGKLHSFHWNVEGKNFFGLHAKLEELYDGVAEEIDAVAERVLMLGGRPVSTLREYLEMSGLKEAPAKAYGAEEVGRSVLEDFTSLIRQIREGIHRAEDADDQSTIDLLTGSLQNYEKTSWMLRAFLG